MLQFWRKAGQREKRTKERSNSSSPVKSNPPASPTLSNGDVSNKSLDCIEVDNISQISRFHDEELAIGDLGESEGSPTGIPRIPSKSRLSKTLPEVLADKGALGYFIQYLEARDAVALIKLWLDVESFRAASGARVRSDSAIGKLSCVPITTDQLEGESNCTTHSPSSSQYDHDKISVGTDSESGSVFESPLHSSISGNDILCKNISVVSSKQTCHLNRERSVPENHAFSPSFLTEPRRQPSSQCGCVSHSTHNEKSPVLAQSEMTRCDTSSVEDSCLQTLEKCPSDSASVSAKGDSTVLHRFSETKSTPSSLCEDQLSPSRANKLIQATLDDAVRIFKKYIASRAPYRVKMPDKIRNKIVDSICREDGLVDADCFTECQAIVFHVMEKEYFNDFLRSDFHCKHQIDVLTSGNVLLSDILYNETALFYFMEFMEQEGSRTLLEFWMTAENFHQHLLIMKGNYDVAEAQSDAIILYDKYFSLQATCPLGFSDKVRLDVEQNICREGGPLPACFKRPISIVFHFMGKNYLQPFLSSQLYFNYLSELINTIQSSPGLLSRSRKSGSECSSGLNISIQNTLLAMEDNAGPPRKIIRNVDEREMSIDSRQLYDPDSLWRRRHQSSLSFGRINSLGRFERDTEPEPSKKEESRLTKVVKKLVNLEEDKAKEEMAWQVAEMIVKDITNITMGSDDEQS